MRRVLVGGMPAPSLVSVPQTWCPQVGFWDMCFFGSEDRLSGHLAPARLERTSSAPCGLVLRWAGNSS